MKILGRTPQGGSIIELSEQEGSLLSSLQDAMKGETWTPIPGHATNGDIEGAFLAVLRFVEVKFAINQLRNLTDELNKTIGVRDEKQTT